MSNTENMTNTENTENTTNTTKISQSRKRKNRAKKLCFCGSGIKYVKCCKKTDNDIDNMYSHFTKKGLFQDMNDEIDTNVLLQEYNCKKFR